MASIEELRRVRVEKLEKLKKEGIDPYPANVKRTHTTSQVYSSFEKLKSFPEPIFIVGRIRSIRGHGRATFVDLEDETGTIQVFLEEEKLNKKTYKVLTELTDIGDFIEVSGSLFKTQKEEKTLNAATFRIITKALLPIPQDRFGLKDVEERHRRRYLDLLVNKGVKALFVKKTRFWALIRAHMLEHGFLEVETPVLENIPGGAEAEPFTTHHNALDKDFYLRISLELPLKRLIVGGYEKVFEIGRIFRNEGIDAEHLQDYTQMEFYWAYQDYNDIMIFLEDMYKKVISDLTGSLTTQSSGGDIDWSREWSRIEYFDIFKEKTGIDLAKTTEEELLKKTKELKIKTEKTWGKGKLIDQIFKHSCKPYIIKPSFLINPPIEIEPLAKRLRSDPARVERFQIMAGGSELGKGFSELNNPTDQRERFEEQMKLREQGDTEAQILDEDFIEALEYGMPPTAGFGLSERLFAFIVNKSVRETVFFPTMREKND